jgi:hypothetical protein
MLNHIKMKKWIFLLMLIGGFFRIDLQAQACCILCPPWCCTVSTASCVETKGSTTSLLPIFENALATQTSNSAVPNEVSCQMLTKKELKQCLKSCKDVMKVDCAAPASKAVSNEAVIDQRYHGIVRSGKT